MSGRDPRAVSAGEPYYSAGGLLPPMRITLPLSVSDDQMATFAEVYSRRDLGGRECEVVREPEPADTIAELTHRRLTRSAGIAGGITGALLVAHFAGLAGSPAWLWVPGAAVGGAVLGALMVAWALLCERFFT